MCEFEITAVYCNCMDKFCLQKVFALGDNYSTHAGHIEKVTSCFRTSKRTCLGMFRNTEPDRLLVLYGMDRDNANSTQDCINARYVIADKTPQTYTDVCEKCKQKCTYMGSPVPSTAPASPPDSVRDEKDLPML